MRAPLPRAITVNREVPNGEPFYVTALSDLHLESSNCDIEGLRKLLAQRAKLERHSFILIGDVFDLVGNQDLRRYRQSAQIDELWGLDDWVNKAIDIIVRELSVEGAVYDLVSPGNHEDEWLKRHGIDITSMLANRLGAARGGYSGGVNYRVHFAGETASRIVFRILYHHGAWGGKRAKGYNGAHDFFHKYDGWHVAFYGHNHNSTMDIDRRHRFRTDRGHQGDFEEYDTYLVNCSSWVDTYSKNAGITHYGERKGYDAGPHKAPLLTIIPHRNGHSSSWFEYSVTM